MKFDDLKLLEARVSRITGHLEEKSGVGFSQSHTFPDGHTHHYKINGVKSLERFEDELLTAFIWVWNMKDYLKTIALANCQAPEEIENIVNASSPLQLVSDVANRAKHGYLRKSRSGQFAMLDGVSISIPQQAISRISVGAFDVSADVSDASLVEFKASILSQSGVTLGEANNILSEALAVWENRAVPFALRA